MSILLVLYYVCSALVTIFLLFPLATHLIYSIRVKPTHKIKIHHEADIACIITAFKNIDLAILAVESLISQKYNNFHIYLIADSCEHSDLIFEFHDKLTILVPPHKLGSKVKSMKYAMESFIRNHEVVTIFDPDNLTDCNFLLECNNYLAQGYKVAQGRRTAKNLDSKTACLDAMGEIYYNYTTRKIPFALGSSATLAGSGMIIEKKLFSDFFEVPCIKENIDNVIPGEDKILYSFVVSRGNQVVYNENAILYDEKIGNAGMIKNQRARWINAYRSSLRDSVKLFLTGIRSFNLNMLIAGTLTLSPPLFLLILFVLLLLGISYFYSVASFIILFSCGLLFVLNFIWILKISKPHPKIWSAIWSIPYFMFNQILALGNIKKSNKYFLTTKNNKRTFIKEIIESNKL